MARINRNRKRINRNVNLPKTSVPDMGFPIIKDIDKIIAKIEKRDKIFKTFNFFLVIIVFLCLIFFYNN